MKHQGIREFEGSMRFVGRGLKRLFWDDDSPLDPLCAPPEPPPAPAQPKLTVTVEGVSLPLHPRKDPRNG